MWCSVDLMYLDFTSISLTVSRRNLIFLLAFFNYSVQVIEFFIDYLTLKCIFMRIYFQKKNGALVTWI